MSCGELRTIHTFGHSTWAIEGFVGLLKAHRIELLVDVRRWPALRLCYNGGNMRRIAAMTKTQARAFRARWAAVSAAEREELRNTPLDRKLQQLVALMSSVGEIGWNAALAREEAEARERWSRLRKAYRV